MGAQCGADGLMNNLCPHLTQKETGSNLQVNAWSGRQALSPVLPGGGGVCLPCLVLLPDSSSSARGMVLVQAPSAPLHHGEGSLPGFTQGLE